MLFEQAPAKESEEKTPKSAKSGKGKGKGQAKQPNKENGSSKSKSPSAAQTLAASSNGAGEGEHGAEEQAGGTAASGSVSQTQKPGTSTVSSGIRLEQV